MLVGRARIVGLLAASTLLVGIGGCSGDDESADLRGVEVDVDALSGSGVSLPGVSTGDVVLPTAKPADGDSVRVPTTTTSTTTTTTTLPPTTTTSTTTTTTTSTTTTSTTTTSTTTTLPPTTTTTIPPPVIPSDILFEARSAVLSDEAGPYLTDLANQIAARYPGAHLTFVGHTDSRGSDSANLVLSQDRAQAVLNVFAMAGYPSELMTAEGRGRSQLLVADTDENGVFDEALGQQNRRVEILIDPP